MMFRGHNVSNADLQRISSLSNELHGHFVAIALKHSAKPISMVQPNGKRGVLLQHFGRDKRMFEIRDNAIYRFGCLQYHFDYLIHLQRDFQRRVSANPLEVYKDDDYQRSLMNSQQYIFDDIILHSISALDYSANLTGYIFYGERFPSLKWKGVMTLSRDLKVELEKTGTGELGQSLVIESFKSWDRKFVAQLEKYRGDMYHAAPDLAGMKASFDIFNNKTSKFVYQAPKKLLRQLIRSGIVTSDVDSVIDISLAVLENTYKATIEIQRALRLDISRRDGSDVI